MRLMQIQVYVWKEIESRPCFTSGDSGSSRPIMQLKRQEPQTGMGSRKVVVGRLDCTDDRYFMLQAQCHGVGAPS